MIGKARRSIGATDHETGLIEGSYYELQLPPPGFAGILVTGDFEDRNGNVRKLRRILDKKYVKEHISWDRSLTKTVSNG